MPSSRRCLSYSETPTAIPPPADTDAPKIVSLWIAVVGVVLDENNYIVDMHLKGKEGAHRQVTGKLIHVGRMKKQIKLHTPDGERVFPLAEEGQKTKGMEEGEPVTACEASLSEGRCLQR